MYPRLKIVGIAVVLRPRRHGGVSIPPDRAHIRQFEDRVAVLAATRPAPAPDPADLPRLPEPVQRYFRFVFPGPAPAYAVVRLSASGQFRRPLTQGFNATTAEQVIAAGVPALMFSATTPVLPGVWARAYDFYTNGEMEMKAKILSTLTVVDEKPPPRSTRSRCVGGCWRARCIRPRCCPAARSAGKPSTTAARARW